MEAYLEELIYMADIGVPKRIIRREREGQPIEVPDWPEREKEEPIHVPNWPQPERVPQEK